MLSIMSYERAYLTHELCATMAVTSLLQLDLILPIVLRVMLLYLHKSHAQALF